LARLQRTTFKTSRAAQYVEARALTAMTGQGEGKFADVVAKELFDNALDACETSGVAPEITLAVEEQVSGGVVITVSDNASGIPQDTMHGALNFDVLVSDKAAYRSPTRGAQGNALKTIFGIPHALGSLEPVVVEAKGTRHEARVWKDPAGQLRVQCDDADLEELRSGTSVTAHVPYKGTSGLFYTKIRFDPGFWARAFSLFNPHAKVKIQRFQEGVYQGKSSVPVSEDSYLPTRDPAKRLKYVPSDPTSAHWYDVEAFKRLVFNHIGHHRHEGGDDLRLRDFVRQFKGLSATKKAKAVCGEFPEIKMLSDFEENGDDDMVGLLLDEMKRHTDAPSHATLGSVGKEHFRERFEEYYGPLHRFDYKKMQGTLHTGMPYVVEFAIAELAEEAQEGELFTAVNYSPTFGDPLENVRFRAEGLSGQGIGSFLQGGFASPEFGHYDDPPSTAVAMHIITPAPLFLDQGKTRLEGFTLAEGRDIGGAIFSKIRPYFREGKRRVKSQRSRERTRPAPSDQEMSLKDATALVLEEAWRHTTGNGQLPVGARRLFYAVRRRIAEHTSKRFNPESGYDYFSQSLLPAYQRARVEAGGEPLAGVYYDPRGKIHEPHTGKSMDLGTRDVDSYDFPPYTFSKFLYVEKRGQLPLLQAAKIEDRYDMALVTEAGFSTVAARTLLASGAEQEHYDVFALHDCDYPGYNILRTLREATERMPEHSMQVHDIGLTVEQVEAMGKTPEAYERTSQVPKALLPLLSEREKEWFVGEYLGKKGNKDTYASKRFELDDLTAPEVIAHIEARLEELGVEQKVIPPEEPLKEMGAKLFREKVDDWVDEIMAEMLNTGELQKNVAEDFMERFKLQGARAWIETEFGRDDSKSWRQAFKATLQRAYVAKHNSALAEHVREYAREKLLGKDRESDEEPEEEG